MSRPDETFFHPQWFRVASLKPRIRANARIHRHVYQGTTWHVLEDATTGRFHRFPPSINHLIGLLDGSRTVEEAWIAAAETLGDELPNQSEMVRLLAHLNNLGLLLGGDPVQTSEIEQRRRTLERAHWLQYLKSPLSVRIPLFDPDRLLHSLAAALAPLLSPLGAVLWCGLILTGIMLAILNWQPLTSNILDRVLSRDNVLLMALVFPFVKIIHEFGHGLAVKRFGGECHEMGILLLALFPVPYVDASTASGFTHKPQRVLVGSAGVLIELALAAVAMIVWVWSGPGLVHAIAYNVIVIASISTLIVNGNPLLRFDGYYVLMDILEIPNFGTRSNQYYGYLIQRYLFGNANAQSPAQNGYERFWFALYGPASFVYRWIVVVSLILIVGAKFLVVGVMLAAWAVVTSIVLPLSKMLKMLFAGPELAACRGRAIAVSLAAVLALALAVGVVQVPRRAMAEGVVWVPESHWVRAGAEGVVEKLAVKVNQPVSSGEVLLVLENEQLRANVAKAAARAEEARLRRDAMRDRRSDFMAAQEELAQAEEELRIEREKLAGLFVNTPYSGRFVLETNDVQGRFFPKGALIGYITDPAVVTVRAVVPQQKAGEIRDATTQIEIRTADRFDRVLETKLLREVPAATDRLPSAVLATFGGGHVAVKPEDRKALQAFERYFQVDLALPPTNDPIRIGTRVHVRFTLKDEPLALRWYREIRTYLREHFRV
jgi:putative peptide zinc metalloprotease protein